MKRDFSKNKRPHWFLAFFVFFVAANIFFYINSSAVHAAMLDTGAAYDKTPEQAEIRHMAAKTSVVDTVKGTAKVFALMPLMGVLYLVSILLSVAGTIFTWVLNVNNINFVLGNSPDTGQVSYLYSIWTIVRDFLNLAFILVLLFIAFSTIFHAEKYSYKKLLWRLILMALLVNFSFPIARFIIDISNVLMYTLINMLFQNGTDGAARALVRIGDRAEMSAILVSGDGSSSLALLIAAIVFGFIFAMTLLVVAVMFIIRMVVLAILIVFSPVAFVASIIPNTSSYADKWWGMLFKYSFFAPIMIFMIYIAERMMTELSTRSYLFSIGAGNQSNAPGLVAKVAQMSIPITLLWFGMGFAQQMGIAGSETVLKGVKSIGKSVSGLGYAQKQWKSYQKVRDERRDKTGLGAKLAKRVNKEQDTLLTKVPGKTGREAQARLDKENSNRVNAEYESRDMKNKSEADLRALHDDPKSSPEVRAAAARALAEQGKATERDMADVQAAFGETSQVFRQLVNNVKSYDPGMAFRHITDAAARTTAIGNAMESMDLNKISASAWTGAQGREMMQTGFNRGLIKSSDIEKMAGKSDAHEVAINGTLASLANASTDHTNKTHRNVQLAHLARSGRMSSHAEASTDWQREVFSRGDADTFKRMDAAYVQAHAASLAQNINSGKYKDIVKGFNNNEARRALNDHIGYGTFAPGSNESHLQNIVHHDPYLNNL